MLTSHNNDISIKLEAGIAVNYLCIHRTIVVGTISSCIVGEMNECAMSCNTAYRVYILYGVPCIAFTVRTLHNQCSSLQALQLSELLRNSDITMKVDD